MTRYIGAIDQGTTSTRFIVFDRAGAIIASAQMEHRQIYPQPGWVEHDPQEIWRNTQAVMAEALRARRPDVSRSCRDRHHQPAGDHAAVGPHQRRAAAQRRGLAGHACRSAGGGVCQRWRAGPLPRSDRVAAGQLLQRPEVALAARQCAASAPSRRSRRACIRYDRYVAAMAAHRQARDRRHQCQPHAVDELVNAGLGRRAAERLRHSAQRCCRASCRPLRCTGKPLWRADRGHSGRPAGSADGSGLLRAGRGEEHLRHRLLPADEHRRRSRSPPPAVWSPPSRGNSASNRRATHWKAPSLSPARWCSGCATISG